METLFSDKCKKYHFLRLLVVLKAFFEYFYLPRSFTVMSSTIYHHFCPLFLWLAIQSGTTKSLVAT